MNHQAIRVKSVHTFKTWDFLVYTLLTLAAVTAGYVFFRYWFSLALWQESPGTLSVLTTLLCLSLGFVVLSWLLLPRMKRPLPLTPRPDWKVGVVTTFVPAIESIEMLEETVKAMVAIRYPHDTWVLDEEDDPEVKRLCEQLGACHFSRKDRSEYQTEAGTFRARTKYGNVNAWLYETGFKQYDIISSFDPDHIPEADFLDRVLGYFEDEGVGYVQAAQVYYNQPASFIARGAAEETYSYYSTIQMATYSLGYPVVTGCHNTHRASALQEVGGFSAHDADDLLITLQYRSRGWQGVYVPEVLAKGLTPVDWNGYLKQQRRWASSVLDIKFRIFPKLSSRLPLSTRTISMLHGLNYLQEGLLPFTMALFLIYMLAGSGVQVMSKLFVPQFFAFIIVLQLNEFYRQRFFLQIRQEWGLHWRAGLLRYAKWPHFLLALMDVLLNRKLSYVVTSKKGSRSNRNPALWLHLAVAVAMTLAWITGAVRGQEFAFSLHIWAILVIAISLGLFATQYMRFPEPFEPSLVTEKQS